MFAFIKWFELAAAIIALINWRFLKNEKFLRQLVYLILVITLLEFIGYFIKLKWAFNARYYNFFVVPLYFSMYSLAYYHGFKQAFNKKLSIITFGLVFLVYIIALYFTDTSKYLNIIGYNFFALNIGSMAILLIGEIVSAESSNNYFRSPLIGLLILIVLYYFLSITRNSVGYYYYFKKETNIMLTFLRYADVVLNYFLYTAFSICFILWGKKKRLY